MTEGIDRRRAVAGAAAAGIGVPLLAACGGDEGGSGGSGGDSSGPLTTTAEVPVGGGTILGDEEVVVTQPTEGDFKAFTSVCTHQGCQVGKVEEGQIICGCHGSEFSAEDGSVTKGPATAPLEEVPITVAGDQISLA